MSDTSSIYRLYTRALLVIGTRPEAIKMAPVVASCQQPGSFIEPIVCFTGQHREMLRQVTDYFGIEADVNLDVMRPNQSLAGLTARCLTGLDETVARYEPDYIVAQGDTTTVMTAAMIAFYHQIPFVHVEAGLRTGDLRKPWPEEYNRCVAGLSTNIHCAPTQRSANNLLAERVDPASIHVTGNTVIDALLWTVERERMRHEMWQQKFAMLEDRRMVLITGHRRESFGEGFESVCQALATLAADFPQTEFVYPVHLNPNVREPVFRHLGKLANIRLIEPASYPEFVWLMDRATLIITDSGGVQEEAPSLKKPVLVMRETTERPEAVDAGAVELVGTKKDAIINSARLLLTNEGAYAQRQIDRSPYGDGNAAQRVVNLMTSSAQTLSKAA